VEDYILISLCRLNHCEARAAATWGEEEQPPRMCGAGQSTSPGARALSHPDSADLLPARGRGQGCILSLSWV